MTAKAQSVVDIPVIDIDDGEQAAKAIVQAASQYGFVFVKNGDHGISIDRIDTMFELVNLSYDIVYPFVF
jgi:isopenicillin N synthase-like dioxygenase